MVSFHAGPCTVPYTHSSQRDTCKVKVISLEAYSLSSLFPFTYNKIQIHALASSSLLEVLPYHSSPYPLLSGHTCFLYAAPGTLQTCFYPRAFAHRACPLSLNWSLPESTVMSIGSLLKCQVSVSLPDYVRYHPVHAMFSLVIFLHGCCCSIMGWVGGCVCVYFHIGI